MPALRRHQLAYLSQSGWDELLTQAYPRDRLAMLATWANNRWPLVVTRQHDAQDPGAVSLGLPAPLEFGRQRIAASVPASALLWLDEFPRAQLVLPLLPRKVRAGIDELLGRLRELQVSPRAYGSYGWQLLTRQAYVHGASDLDLLVAVESEGQADAVAQALDAWPHELLRIDGELLFRGGTAVSWREWHNWRAGAVRSILVRSLRAATIETSPWIPAYV